MLLISEMLLRHFCYCSYTKHSHTLLLCYETQLNYIVDVFWLQTVVLVLIVLFLIHKLALVGVNHLITCYLFQPKVSDWYLLLVALRPPELIHDKHWGTTILGFFLTLLISSAAILPWVPTLCVILSGPKFKSLIFSPFLFAPILTINGDKNSKPYLCHSLNDCLFWNFLLFSFP